jgi:hypothetical protein
MFPPHPNGRVSGPVFGGQRLAHNEVYVKQKDFWNGSRNLMQTLFANKRAASFPVFPSHFLRMSPLHPLASGCNGKKTRQSGTPSAARLRQSRFPRTPARK